MINAYNVPYFHDVSKSMIEAGNLGDHHVNVECQNIPENNMATLAPEGPYAFTVFRLDPDAASGTRLHIATSYDEVLHYYKAMHARVDVLDWNPITNVRGAWYGFHHGIGHTRSLTDGTVSPSEMLIMLPTFGKSGISGELYWFRHPDPNSPVDPPAGPDARAEAFRRHNALLDAFRNADIDGILDAFAENCQTAICDYVSESGTLACMYGRDDLRAYYKSFFDKFNIRSVEVIQRVSDDWFVFCELLWCLEYKKSGKIVSCNTAEHAARAPDGRFHSRIGHGTAFAAAT